MDLDVTMEKQDIIVIGASAGGVGALERLISGLLASLAGTEEAGAHSEMESVTAMSSQPGGINWPA